MAKKKKRGKKKAVKVSRKSTKAARKPARKLPKPARKKEIPLGVKLISILFYIGAVFIFLSGVIMILSLFGISATDLSLIEEALGISSAEITNALTVSGIVLIIFGVIFFFIGRGLWRLKSWARVLTLIIAIIVFIGSLTPPINLISLIVAAIVVWYLLFSKNVRAAFK